MLVRHALTRSRTPAVRAAILLRDPRKHAARDMQLAGLGGWGVLGQALNSLGLSLEDSCAPVAGSSKSALCQPPLCSHGAYEIPMTHPSIDCNRATVWPHRLRPRIVQQLEALRLQLLGRGLHRVGVGDLELNRDLGNRAARGPVEPAMAVQTVPMVELARGGTPVTGRVTMLTRCCMSRHSRRHQPAVPCKKRPFRSTYEVAPASIVPPPPGARRGASGIRA